MFKRLLTIAMSVAIAIAAISLTGCSAEEKGKIETFDYGSITFYEGTQITRTEPIVGYDNRSLANTNPNVFAFSANEDRAWIALPMRKYWVTKAEIDEEPFAGEFFRGKDVFPWDNCYTVVSVE